MLPLAEARQQMHEYLKIVVRISLNNGPDCQDDQHFNEYSTVGVMPQLAAASFSHLL